MRSRSFRIICLLACLATAIPVLAQFGHPLKGSWSGDWGPSTTNRNRILLDFDWSGCPQCRLTGVLNPGPNAAPLTNLTLTPPDGGVANADAAWALHFEAQTKDESGAMVRVVVDGRLENLGAYRRIISGFWTQGNVKGDFKVIRN